MECTFIFHCDSCNNRLFLAGETAKKDCPIINKNKYDCPYLGCKGSMYIKDILKHEK